METGRGSDQLPSLQLSGYDARHVRHSLTDSFGPSGCPALRNTVTKSLHPLWRFKLPKSMVAVGRKPERFVSHLPMTVRSDLQPPVRASIPGRYEACLKSGFYVVSELVGLFFSVFRLVLKSAQPVSQIR